MAPLLVAGGLGWHVTPAGLLLLLGAALSFGLSILAWRRRHVPGSVAFALLMLAIGEWGFTYALELAAPDLGTKLRFDELEYVGIVANPVWAAVFALWYSGRGRWLIPTGLIALSVIPVATLILLWIDPTHGLVQAGVTLSSTGQYSMLIITHGPWFWVHLAYSYLLLTSATLILLASLFHSPVVYRTQILAMLVGIVAPLLSNGAYIAGASPFPHLDLTPFAFTLTGIAVFLAFFRHRFLDLSLGFPVVARSVLVDQLPDAVFLLDNRGSIVEANVAARWALGRAASEIIGRPIDVFLPVHVDASRGDSGVPASSREVRLGPEANARSYDMVIAPQYLGREYLAGWTIVLRDVTAYKQIQLDLFEINRQLEAALAELRQTQEHVIQQERLRALGEMASGIAHDFNNALAIVSGFLELLSMMRFEEDLDAATVRSYVSAASIAAADATSVVRRLREFYRPRAETEPARAVDLNALVRQTRELTEPRWLIQPRAQGIAIDFVTELGDVPAVVGNPSQFREILTNLIFNAVDALPRGGTIAVATELTGDSVSLSVSDNGLGMSEDVRRRCLEPFFTTKGPEGSGMGLAVAYGVVQRHKGSLQIESEVGRGTRVIVRLPAAAPTLTRETAPASEPIQVGPLKILLVEDLPQLQDLFSKALTEAGHTVEIASNGREGLEKFLRGWFDVVITDQVMEEMSGDQLARAIRSRAPTKPIILLTGLADQLTAGASETFSAVLSKPITAVTLRATVSAVMARESDVAS